MAAPAMARVRDKRYGRDFVRTPKPVKITFVPPVDPEESVAPLDPKDPRAQYVQQAWERVRRHKRKDTVLYAGELHEFVDTVLRNTAIRPTPPKPPLELGRAALRELCKGLVIVQAEPDYQERA